MNRNFKVRGQRIDNNEWVYGYYVKDPNGKHRIYYQPFKDASSNTYHFVKEETISRFTGFTDANENDIYEKQKCKFKDIIGNIEWEQQAGAFWLKWDSKSESGRIFQRYKELSATFSDGESYQCDYLEIVGDVA